MGLNTGYNGLDQVGNSLLRVGQGLALAATLLEASGLVHNQVLAQTPESASTVNPGSDGSEVLEYELSSVSSDSYKRFMAGIDELAELRTVRTGDMVAIVDPVAQVMGVFEVQDSGYVLVEAYKVSTAAKGLGNLINSDRTPTGVFELQYPEGQGKPLGYILGPKKSHRVGKVERNLANGRGMALMTTRKVPVNGIEKANKNALRRGVAVHGTNKEIKLGRAASGGCVRMGNDEAVEFADAVAAPGKAYMVIVDPKDPRYKAVKNQPALASTHEVRPEASLTAQRAHEEAAARARAEEKAAAKAKAEAEEAARLAQEAERLKKAEEECVAGGEAYSFQDGQCWVATEASPPMIMPDGRVIGSGEVFPGPATHPGGSGTTKRGEYELSPYTPLTVGQGASDGSIGMLYPYTERASTTPCIVSDQGYERFAPFFATGRDDSLFIFRHLPGCEGGFPTVNDKSKSQRACSPQTSDGLTVYYCDYPQDR